VTSTAAFRSGRKVALVGRYPARDPALPPYIPNLGLYNVAAAVADGGFDDLDLRIWDFPEKDPQDIINEINTFDPDVIGYSAYLWSLPVLMEINDALKRGDPSRLSVFGGPSARENMLAHAPFVEMIQPDILAIGEGERTMTEIVALKRRSLETLGHVRGIALRQEGGWKSTPPRHPAKLDELASPYALDLVPQTGLGIMETYRGCPFTCSFCEWGVMDAPKNVRSVASISQEFGAIAENGRSTLLLVDAGLNLNKAAFTNLSAAAEQTGFLDDRNLICEVYPAKVRDEHLKFLDSVGNPHIGVGLQSFDSTVLSGVERKYDEARFNNILTDLRSVASLAIEIILGLPGDSPEQFKRNFERARALPYALRVYHCLVLPSALMKRSPKEHVLDYDPVTLKMRSCLGWSRESLAETVDFVHAHAKRENGASGEFFWVFPPR
jgi:radical SAM superfamily enzyme YgiQ (UPF0313 family)